MNQSAVNIDDSTRRIKCNQSFNVCFQMRVYLFCSNIRTFSNVARRRTFASLQRPDAIPNVFDRQAKLKQRERTCRDPDYNLYSYVHERVAQSLVDRIFDIKR